MATVYINDGATGGAQDGTSPSDAYLHPDDIPALSLGAGDEVIFVSGSGPYQQTTAFGGKGNGASGNPVTWKLNFCEWTAGLTLNDVSGGEWHESASGSNEYYFTASEGANPGLSEPSCGTVNGHYAETQAEEALYQMGNAFGGTNHSIDLGSLPDGRLGWGDNDTLGFNTVYVRLDDLSHSTANIIVSQLTTVFDTNFTHQKLEDVIFSYADEAIEPRSASTSKWELHRCIFKYMGWQGVNVSQDNDVDMISCLGFFAGHRFFLIAANADLADVNIYNCLSIKSHLFGWISRWYNSTINLINNIGYNLSAGVLDTESDVGGTPTINEDYNVWYPDFAGGATSMNYPDNTNTRWTTTGANSFPPSANTGINSISANEAAGAIEPTFNIDLSDLDSITNGDLINIVCNQSSLIGQAAKWWTGSNPQGSNGEPYSDIDTDFGTSQSTLGPFHPKNLL